MRVITTAILGAIAICLGIVISIVDREESAGPGAAAAANVLVRFPQESVQRLTIERGSEKTVIAQRAGAWFFVEPIQDRVDARLMNALLDQLNHLTVVDALEDAQSEGDAFGLASGTAVRLRLEGESDETGKIDEEIVLGTSAPRANSLYSQRRGDEAVFVVDGNPRAWIESPTATMRDPRILSAPVDAIVQLGIRRSTGELQLQRRLTPPKQDWALTKPLSTWADREILDELLASLAGLKIEEVMVDADPDEKIPNPLPDGAAVIQARVFGIEQPLTIYLSEVEAPPVEGAAALVEARVSDRPAVYRFHSRILETLPAKADDVRNRTLARIPMAYLESIWVQSLIDPDVILLSEATPEGMTWNVKLGNKLLPANVAEVMGVVNGVNEAAIQDFASDTGENLEEFGLLPPARRITFNLKFPGQPNPDGTPGQVQQMQRVLNLGWRDGDEQGLFANFTGEPYVYELDPTFVNLIPTHPIKWRSLQVLTFNAFHLESITREIPGRDTLKLTYDYRRDDWSEATRNGLDVLPTLDRASANRLRDRLGSLTAAGWYLSLATAYEALQTPDTTFVIVTKELDPAIGEAVRQTYRVNFARFSDKVIFGQVEGSPDVFFLDNETYGNLKRPVTTSRAAQ